MSHQIMRISSAIGRLSGLSKLILLYGAGRAYCDVFPHVTKIVFIKRIMLFRLATWSI